MKEENRLPSCLSKINLLKIIYNLWTRRTEKRWTLNQNVNCWPSLSVVLGWVGFLCGSLNHPSWIMISNRETTRMLDVLSFSSRMHQVSSRESQSRPSWSWARLLTEEDSGWFVIKFASHKWLISVLISLLFIHPINIFYTRTCIV